MQIEWKLWRKHSRLGIWIEYLATFEDDKLVGLRNVTNGYDIPLNTKTARMIARRHRKFSITSPTKVDVAMPPSTKMRYVIRYENTRFTGG
ncbi:MAG: hypothetical protein G01um10143_101 [Parcubacteria group bacterium Gr01-1014_3]|nr:MAG: hypothetical protein G01um10143_101 [Parcubacteria group bacterium Gr01-1014_3]